MLPRLFGRTSECCGGRDGEWCGGVAPCDQVAYNAWLHLKFVVLVDGSGFLLGELGSE